MHPISSARLAVAALASRQHGVVAAWQLLEIGATRETIKYGLATGWLHRVHRGVYAVGHSVLSGNGRWMAAVLACGPGAALSHWSAAALWAIRPTASPLIHVTAPSQRRRPGIRVHRARVVQRTTVDDIPVTTVARTILDLAPSLNPRERERLIEEAEKRRLFDLRALEQTAREANLSLGAVRGLAVHEPPPTRAESERVALQLFEDHDLPRPAVNVWVEGQEVDMCWWEQRVIAEIDGYEHHGNRFAFERDRRRDADLRRAGWTVVRITWRMLRDDPRGVAEMLSRLLEPTGSGRTRRARGRGARARASP